MNWTDIAHHRHAGLIGPVVGVIAALALMFLAGCVSTYGDDDYDGYYGSRIVHDRYGEPWTRCHIRGRPAWCRVD